MSDWGPFGDFWGPFGDFWGPFFGDYALDNTYG